ncbi:MAG: hypothetical protein GEV06_16620 [Luteitalea sp.]|nr:hypothetical protein [Luteitalea sp.]
MSKLTAEEVQKIVDARPFAEWLHAETRVRWTTGQSKKRIRREIRQIILERSPELASVWDAILSDILATRCEVKMPDGTKFRPLTDV